MAQLWLTVVSVMAMVCAVGAQYTGCSDGSPFWAPARNVLHFGYDTGGNLYTWCTHSGFTNLLVTINFTVPVVITRFLSSGSTYIPLMLTAYTTNFTVEYTQRNSNGDLNYVYYKTETDSKIKYFTQNRFLKQFQLESPIVTESLRLRPLEWFDSTASPNQFDIVCIGVALFGCTTTEATVEQMATTQSSNTGGTTDVGGIATAQPVVLRDYQTLEIALPIGIITIIVVITMVAIGVLLCVTRGRSHHKYEVPQTTPLSPTLLLLDNSALYTTPSEIRRDTIRAVNNELYGEDSGTNSYTVAHDNLEVIYSDSGYEQVSTRQSLSNNHRGNVDNNSAYVPVMSQEGEGDASYVQRGHDFTLESNYENYDIVQDRQHTVNIHEETAH
ncbi:uncharacterized protein LOC135351900 isoform X2 [Halichondria panicea]|uniref:uncharacterized protein LOC135351900 isoform X2 n=1 Tax=Halichondria panicea TaxID=6063 RepID=UPI00312B43E1